MADSSVDPSRTVSSPRLTSGDWARVVLVAVASALPVIVFPDADERATAALTAVVPGIIAVIACALWLSVQRRAEHHIEIHRRAEIRREEERALQRRQEAQLREEHARALARAERSFETFFEEAPFGIALLDDRALIVECNRVFRRIANKTGEIVSGRPLAELLRQEDRHDLPARLSRLASGAAGPGPLEARVISTEREVVASIFANRIEHSGGSTRLIIYVLDTTDQKNLEAQFAQSQKMQAVGQLAGGVAHDFNNLLTAMIGFCDLLLQRHQPGDASFADIMQVKQNANRAANLVRQLLAFSRQQTLQPKVLDITDALTELSHLLRRLMGASIELAIVHSRDLFLVKVDQGQLEQVIVNLAVNARDAMPDGGKLVLETGKIGRAHV